MNKSILILLSIFFLFQIPIFFSLAVVDEMVYYQMGNVVSEGNIPYKDFFFSHPPLQIYLYAGIIKLFGTNIWILKCLTYLFQIGSAIFIFLIAKERYNEKIGLIATFLFLSSYDILAFGSYAIGLEIAVFFFMVSLYLNNKRPFIAGMFFALSIMTRLHLFPLGLILLFYSKERLIWVFIEHT